MNARVRMVACMSLDGFIARSDRAAPNQEDAGGWTSAEDKREFWREVDAADIVVGGRTSLNQMPAVDKPVALISRNPEEALDSEVNGTVEWVVDPYPSELHDFLAKLKDKTLLLCGGSMTYDLFLRWNLVDHLVLVVEPVMFGHGVPLRARPKTRGGQDRCRFSLVKCAPLNSRGTLRLDLERAKVW